LELDMLASDGYKVSVPAVVVPEVTALKLPLGAPTEPRVCVTWKIPEAALSGICCALAFCCEEEEVCPWNGIFMRDRNLVVAAT
jgi:hypothetical protein